MDGRRTKRPAATRSCGRRAWWGATSARSPRASATTSSRLPSRQSRLVASTLKSLKQLQKAASKIRRFGKMEKMLAPPLLAVSSYSRGTRQGRSRSVRANHGRQAIRNPAAAYARRERAWADFLAAGLHLSRVTIWRVSSVRSIETICNATQYRCNIQQARLVQASHAHACVGTRGRRLLYTSAPSAA